MTHSYRIYYRPRLRGGTRDTHATKPVGVHRMTMVSLDAELRAIRRAGGVVDRVAVTLDPIR